MEPSSSYRLLGECVVTSMTLMRFSNLLRAGGKLKRCRNLQACGFIISHEPLVWVSPDSSHRSNGLSLLASFGCSCVLVSSVYLVWLGRPQGEICIFLPSVLLIPLIRLKCRSLFHYTEARTLYRIQNYMIL